jgi:hypothetical protein
MTRPAPGSLKAASKPALKSPLRASTMPVSSDATSSPGAADGSTAEPPGAEISATQLRKMQISEFSAWLRTQTNKHQRPFQEETSHSETGSRQTGPSGHLYAPTAAWDGSPANARA